MKFLTSVGYHHVIVNAEPSNIEKMKEPLHSYSIIAPKSFKNDWPTISSSALTILPEKYQRQSDQDNLIYIDEIRAICKQLPNQADRRYFIIFARENPDDLTNEQNIGIIGKLSSYSSEGLKMLISDFNTELKIASDVNLQAAKITLEKILAEKLISESHLSNNFSI